MREARLEIAARLLLETPIPIAEIGRMVGYSSVSTFRGRLGGFLGMSAAQYRRRAPRTLERGGRPPAGADTEEYWERMLAGELSEEEARALDAYLERLAPDSSPPTAAEAEAERWTRWHETLADGFVTSLRDLDLADRRRFARDAVWFPDATFFERLSREAAADPDPERAVEWALLAIDSLAANQTFGLETDPRLAALAWARLALARWRAGNLAW